MYNHIEISLFFILVLLITIPIYAIYKELKKNRIKKKNDEINESMIPHKIDLYLQGYPFSDRELDIMLKYALLNDYTHPRYGDFIKKCGKCGKR